MRTATATEDGSATDTTFGSTSRLQRSRLRSLALNPSIIAVAIWLAALPAAFAVPRLFHANPFSNKAMAVVLASAFLGVAAVATWASRWRHHALAGIAAGLAGTWTAFTLQTALYGTPYGYGGLQGDVVRMSSLAMRYSDTVFPSDPWVPGVVAEYPMLYPWLIGRSAALFDIPAWKLLAAAETITISFAVIVAFWMWSRWVSNWSAFAISVTSLLIFSDPRKAFEVVALAIFVPWVLGTFASPPRGRMHWVASGMLAGLLYLLYPGWMITCCLAIPLLAWLTSRTEQRPLHYLGYVAKVVAVATLVASWQLLPYLRARLTGDPEVVFDLYDSPTLNSHIFPMVEPDPIGVLQIIGFVGMVWLLRSTWWSRPLFILAVGAFAYRVLMMVRFAATDHTMFLHYSSRLYSVALAAGGVLVLHHVGTRIPDLLRRADLNIRAPRRVGVVTLALLTAWMGYTFAFDWMPKSSSAYAAQAHLEPFPSGGYPRFAPASGRIARFPVGEIQQFVEAEWKSTEKPVVLSPDERLFAYLPWYGYIGSAKTASSSLVRWNTREDELRRIAAITNPDDFANAIARTSFGSIDVLILQNDGNALRWLDVEFSREQFSTNQWAIADLPADLFIAVRRT